jgi:predicted amidohydrolase YtcJ
MYWYTDHLFRRTGSDFTTHSLRVTIYVVLFLVCLGNSSQGQPSPRADLIVRNGQIYTVNAHRDSAEAIAIRDGIILYVGTNAGSKRFIGTHTHIINAHGGTVLPGFIDSHIHPMTGGLLLQECSLHDLQSEQSILAKIDTCAKKNPEKLWITGSGWDLHIFPDSAPNKELLDRILPDRPAFFEAIDGHSAWVNSAALKIAGVNRFTPDPPGGKIVRDSEGEPTGTLRESAIRLISANLPPTSKADYLRGLRAAMELAKKFGITSIIEANASPEMLQVYAKAAQMKQLTFRVVASQHFDKDLGLSQIPKMVAARDRWHSLWFSCNQVKLFVDGVLESHTAALLRPYLDTNDQGSTNYTAAEFNEIITALDQNALQVHIHAIGDRAVRMSLDAFEAARMKNGPHDIRHHIAHLELIDPDDLPRFSQLGVVANFQALWAYPDEDIVKLTVPVLGPARSRWLYPIRSVVQNGGTIVGGSDWSVTSLNPLEAIQIAVTRQSPEGKGPILNSEEIVDLPQIIAAYTINGAYLRHQEKLIGSLEVGKRADLVILSADLFQIPAARINAVNVLFTILDGKVIYSTRSQK